MNRKTQQSFWPILFWLYLIFIFVVGILKFSGTPDSLSALMLRVEFNKQWAAQGFPSVNLIPFHSIASQLRFGEWFPILANLFLLAPYGFLLPLAYKKIDHIWKALVCALLLTIFFEVFQLVTFTGSCDIDDVLLNTAGAIVGYLCSGFLRQFTEQLQVKHRQ